MGRQSRGSRQGFVRSLFRLVRPGEASASESSHPVRRAAQAAAARRSRLSDPEDDAPSRDRRVRASDGKTGAESQGSDECAALYQYIHDLEAQLRQAEAQRLRDLAGSSVASGADSTAASPSAPGTAAAAARGEGESSEWEAWTDELPEEGQEDRKEHGTGSVESEEVKALKLAQEEARLQAQQAAEEAQDAMALAVALPAPVLGADCGRVPACRGDDPYRWISDFGGSEADTARLRAAGLTLAACRDRGYTVDGTQVRLHGMEDMLEGTRIIRAGDVPVLLRQRRAESEAAQAAAAGALVATPTSWVRHVAGDPVRLARDTAMSSRVCLITEVSSTATFLSGERHGPEESLLIQSTLFPSLLAAQEKAAAQGLTLRRPSGSSSSSDSTETGPMPRSFLPEDIAVLSPEVELLRGSSADGYPFEARSTALCAVASIGAQLAVPLDRPLELVRARRRLYASLLCALTVAELAGATSVVVPELGSGVHGASDVGQGLRELVAERFHGAFKEIHVVGTRTFVEAAAPPGHDQPSAAAAAAAARLRASGAGRSGSVRFALPEGSPRPSMAGAAEGAANMQPPVSAALCQPPPAAPAGLCQPPPSSRSLMAGGALAAAEPLPPRSAPRVMAAAAACTASSSQRVAPRGKPVLAAPPPPRLLVEVGSAPSKAAGPCAPEALAPSKAAGLWVPDAPATSPWAPGALAAAGGTDGRGGPPLLQPRTKQVLLDDPRVPANHERGRVGVVAFSRGERAEPWDERCGASFLGNYFDLGPCGLRLSVGAGNWWECIGCNPEPQGFRNAEAAFHALKFWRGGRALEFENLTGAQAAMRSAQLEEPFADGHERLQLLTQPLQGLSDPFVAMLHVLRAKFCRGSPMARALMATGSDFLLHHDARKGDDPLWSDDRDGSGSNWLGLQLMLLRDELQYPVGEVGEWTEFLEQCFDTATGAARPTEGAERWQRAVRAAAAETGRLQSPTALGRLTAGTKPPVIVDFCQNLACRKADQCLVQ